MPDTAAPAYLFVYGTLRSSSNHQMNKVLERYADRVGRGKIPGILYDVGRYPGAVKRSVDLGPGRRVHAWIYLYNRPTTGLTRIRSGDYLNYLNQPRETRPRGRIAAKSGS